MFKDYYQILDVSFSASKEEIKKVVANGIFRKGTTVADIEQKALYVTL